MSEIEIPSGATPHTPDPDEAPSEREQVVRWLTTIVGWRLHKVHHAPKGRSVYEFRDEDSDGFYAVYKLKQGQLRWRFMRETGFRHVPALRAEAERIWSAYVAERLAEEAPRDGE